MESFREKMGLDKDVTWLGIFKGIWKIVVAGADM